VAKTDTLSHIYYSNPVIHRGDWGYGLGGQISILDIDIDIFPRHRLQTGSGALTVAIGNCSGWRVKLKRLGMGGALSLPLRLHGVFLN
jgi:hypothetical protein